MKILDRYTHGGNQYEFFKLPHEFYLTNLDGTPSDWSTSNRPSVANLKPISERNAIRKRFDIIMIRNHSLNPSRYKPFIKKGAKAIGVVHTVHPFKFPNYVHHIVFNSKTVMMKYRDFYKGKKTYYIPHGLDPDEFKPLDIERNDRVLSVLNAFKVRGKDLGLPLWREVRTNVGCVDLLGSRNDDLKGQHGEDGCGKFMEEVPMKRLLKYYSKYGVFFNPTAHSAMPRTRVESMFCKMPLVTTDNYDIGSYVKHNKTAIISNDPIELTLGIQRLLDSEDMRIEYGEHARDVAIKHFHIKDNLARWEEVISKV